MLKLLNSRTGSEFYINKNSFATCFIFDEIEKKDQLKRRFKVYNKFLALLLSKSAQSGIGMNTQYLYTQKNLVTSIINETSELGYTRIEISYTAESPEAVKQIFSNSFLHDSKADINILEQCLNKVPGICFRVPLRDLLHVFQEETRFNQLFIRLPNTVAIIYC